jgi:hypothetical protein
MKISKLMVAAAALAGTLGGAVTAEAMGQRRGYDYGYERDRGDYRYRSDRDRRDYRRDYRNDRDRRSEWRNRDRRGYQRNGSYEDMARRNYELERDMQTCYRNGRRICP